MWAAANRLSIVFSGPLGIGFWALSRVAEKERSYPKKEKGVVEEKALQHTRSSKGEPDRGSSSES